MRPARLSCLDAARAATMMLCLLLFAPLAAIAHDFVYRSETADGRIVYGDAPAPGAVASERVPLDKLEPHDKPGPQGAAPWLSPGSKALVRNFDERIARLRVLEAAEKSAVRDLARVESQMRAGMAVREGDRQGRRLTSSFFERQRLLLAQVQAARENLANLRQQRLALQN